MEKPKTEDIDFLHECEISFASSGGPGGQNVNRTASKAIIKWPFEKSKILTPEQIDRIIEKLHSQVYGKEGGRYILVTCQEERNQYQNKSIAIRKIQGLVRRAFIPIVERNNEIPEKAKKKRKFHSRKDKDHRKKKKAGRGRVKYE